MPHEPQPQAPDELDAEAVRTWSSLALAALGRAREDIDAINVYPVADADTGTNLYLTAESADRGLAEAFPGVTDGTGTTSLAEAVRAWAHGALVGARGNSGTILAQLLRGVADVLGAEQPERSDPAEHGGKHGRGTGGLLARALTRAAEEAYAAVAHPVEGTMLTVAGAAARAGEAAGDAAGTAVEVARAAYDGARAALAETPGQLAALSRAGVVDAGGCGLVVVFGALWQALSGQEPAAEPVRGRAVPVPQPQDPCAQEEDGPAYEVIYLLEATEAAVGELRERLDGLGDSLVVVGGDGLWNVHVHVDDPGAAVEAGVVAGRPYRIRITHFGTSAAGPAASAPSGPWSPSSPARDWPDCAGRPVRPPCSCAPASSRPPPNSSTPYAARTPARWCSCRAAPSCAPPRPRRPNRPAPRVCAWP